MTYTLYSTPTCPFCNQLKAFLDEHKITYTNVDVSSDQKKAEEMIKKSGQMGVPVSDIDGKIIIGFDRKTIESALGFS